MTDGLNVFYFDWEFDVLNWFQSIHNPVLDVLMKFFTFLGNSGWFPIVAVFVILIFVKDKRVGWQGVVSLMITFLVCNLILKNIFLRARPCDVWNGMYELIVSRPHDASFPSGHTNASFTVAAVVFSRNKKWGSLAIAIATLIAISRLYLFMHFPTDVLAGACVGVCGAIIGYYIVNFVYKKTGRPVDSFKFF